MDSDGYVELAIVNSECRLVSVADLGIEDSRSISAGTHREYGPTLINHWHQSARDTPEASRPSSDDSALLNISRAQMGDGLLSGQSVFFEIADSGRDQGIPMSREGPGKLADLPGSQLCATRESQLSLMIYYMRF